MTVSVYKFRDLGSDLKKRYIHFQLMLIKDRQINQLDQIMSCEKLLWRTCKCKRRLFLGSRSLHFVLNRRSGTWLASTSVYKLCSLFHFCTSCCRQGHQRRYLNATVQEEWLNMKQGRVAFKTHYHNAPSEVTLKIYAEWSGGWATEEEGGGSTKPRWNNCLCKCTHRCHPEQCGQLHPCRAFRWSC